MKTATIFKNGKSTQAVRIPRAYQMKGNEVWIEKVGDCLILTPKPHSWDDFFNSGLQLTDDFDMSRDQNSAQDRGDVLS